MKRETRLHVSRNPRYRRNKQRNKYYDNKQAAQSSGKRLRGKTAYL